MKLINIDIYQLNEICKTKKLICFGTGQMVRNYLEKVNNLHLEEDIYCFLDNDKNKEGTKFSICGKEYNIYSPQYLNHIDLEKYILLISCGDAHSIYYQLENIDMECCFINFIRSETNETDEKNRYYPKNLKLTEEPRIPKIIHYCWFGNNPMPLKNQKWIASWKRFCPDYEIVEWNESNYDVTKNEFMLQAYKDKKWGYVSDYARLDIIYQHGGIYLDADVEIIKNIDDLLYQSAFFGIETSKLINTGLGFGAIQGFPLVREMLELYNGIKFSKEKMVAVPTMMKDFFNRKGYINNGEYQIVEGMTIYPEKVLSGKCNLTNRILTTEHTYMIHHYDGSWVDKEKKEKVNKMKELFQLVE